MARSYRIHLVVLLLGVSLLGCSAVSADPAPTATAIAPPPTTACALPETPPTAQYSSVDVGFVPRTDVDLAAPTCNAGQPDPLSTSLQDMFGTKPFGSNSHPPDVELGGRDDFTSMHASRGSGMLVIGE